MDPTVRRSRLAPDQQITYVAMDSSPENGKSTNQKFTKPEPNDPAPNDPAPNDLAPNDLAPHQPVQTSDSQVIQVVVSDIHMSFLSMVAFLVKAAFAAIPAIIIIALIWAFIFGFISGFLKYR